MAIYTEMTNICMRISRDTHESMINDVIDRTHLITWQQRRLPQKRENSEVGQINAMNMKRKNTPTRQTCALLTSSLGSLVGVSDGTKLGSLEGDTDGYTHKKTHENQHCYQKIQLKARSYAPHHLATTTATTEEREKSEVGQINALHIVCKNTPTPPQCVLLTSSLGSLVGLTEKLGSSEGAIDGYIHRDNKRTHENITKYK